MVDDEEGGTASDLPVARIVRDGTISDRARDDLENQHHEIDHTEDKKGPFIVDAWPEDGMLNWKVLAAAGWPFVGAIAKMSEGMSPAISKEYPTWDVDTWRALGAVSGPEFLRGDYVYARFSGDPVKQADFSEQRIELGGGHGPYDLPTMLDAEAANNPASPGFAELEDWINRFAERKRVLTGRPPILYGNQYLWSNGLKSTCGCDFLVVARYAPTLPAAVYQRIGWSWSGDPNVKPPTLLGWQYAGKKNAKQMEGDVSVTGYPLDTPVGYLDLIAILLGNGGRAGFANLQRYLGIAPNPAYTA